MKETIEFDDILLDPETLWKDDENNSYMKSFDGQLYLLIYKNGEDGFPELSDLVEVEGE